MKFKILIFLFLLMSGSQVKAQYYFYNGDYYEADFTYEVGGSFGFMNAMTDLGGRNGLGKKGLKDFNIQTTDICGGLFFSVMFQNTIGLRVEGTFGRVSGYDSILKKPDEQERFLRNLSFRSPIAEVVLVGEFHPFEMFVNYNEDRHPPVVSPYLLAGIGYFHFKPQAKINGNYVDLQPLHTEGQGFPEYPNVKEYKLNAWNFPLGIGARYDLSPILNVRAELLFRALSTDYLDDISGRYIEPSVFANHLSGIDLTHAILLNDRHKPGAQTAHPGGIRGKDRTDSYLTFSFKLGLTLGRERRN
ncbi:MAG: hypothetical protein ABIP35_11370 [Ginsengibacter sp.]